MNSKNLTHDILKSLVTFDEDTGVFISLVPHGSWNRFPTGSILSSPTKSRYGERSRTVVPGFGRFLTHRLVWFYKTGSWPKQQIDHIDRNQMNNRFENLRDVSNSVNQHNTGVSRNNKSGIKGICYRSRRSSTPYQAGISINKVVYRQFFKTLEEAIEYRKELEKLIPLK